VGGYSRFGRTVGEVGLDGAQLAHRPEVHLEPLPCPAAASRPPGAYVLVEGEGGWVAAQRGGGRGLARTNRVRLRQAGKGRTKGRLLFVSTERLYQAGKELPVGVCKSSALA